MGFDIIYCFGSIIYILVGIILSIIFTYIAMMTQKLPPWTVENNKLVREWQNCKKGSVKQFVEGMGTYCIEE
tara:strand:- start:445 stop:660 length:216 start_codon:yes stop_codon:yes gene_type:complete